MDRSLVIRQALKWMIGALAGSLLAIAMLAAALSIASYFRAPLIRLLSACTGREIEVQGSLQAHLVSLTPRLIAENVTIRNPPWMPPGATAEVTRLSLVVELLPLFTHSVVIRRLEADGATLHLVRDSAGRANWQWTEPGKREEAGAPIILSLSIRQAHVELDDAPRQLQFEGIVTAQDVPEAQGTPWLRVVGAGQLNGRAATFAINGDPFVSIKAKQPYRFTFAERSSGSRLDGHGFLPRPFDFGALDVTFAAAGLDLKDLYFLTGVSLPNTGAYGLSGTLVREGAHFHYGDLVATFGQSDVRGTLSIETSSGRPRFDADLYSHLLRMMDLGAQAAGRGAAPEAGKDLLLSDVQVPLSGMRRSDGAVKFHAEGLTVGKLRMHAVAALVKIDHGVLLAAPLSAAFTQGTISGRVSIDATREVPSTDLDLRISDLRLDQLDRKDLGQPPFDGLLQARIVLKGLGNSIHRVAATANGTVTAVLPRGAIRAEIDLARGLGLLLSKDGEQTGVRCGLANFQAREGTLFAQSLLLDTDPVVITGTGEIHLDSEVLDLALSGRPKTRRLLRLRSALSIRGTLAHPLIGIEARKSSAQTGKAAGLGILLLPLEPLRAFVDPDLAKDADCTAVVAEARTDGVRVSASNSSR
jgi:AsmA family protein